MKNSKLNPMNWFNFLKNVKLINVNKTKFNLQLNVKDEKNAENVMFSIERRELNPAYNLASLVQLGVKIIGPEKIISCANWNEIIFDDINKLNLLIPQEKKGMYNIEFSKIRFSVIHDGWMTTDDSKHFTTKEAIVNELVELKSFVDGNKYIVESKAS